ncbi:MAG: hypothetical protein IJO33_04410 [Bacilli bacterium]|nr:hypothetical protein [Bacilli bacterium]
MKKVISVFIMAIVLCIFTYNITKNPKKNILALGDGLCLANSIYDVESHSYNHYIKDYYYEKKLLNNFNDEFCKTNLSVRELNALILENKQINNQSIQYLLDNADVLTLAIGFDELKSYAKLTNQIKKDFLNDYAILISNIMDMTNAKILVIGYYPNYFKDALEISKKIQAIVVTRNLDFINIEDVSKNKEFFYDIKQSNLNIKGHKQIFNKIEDYL